MPLLKVAAAVVLVGLYGGLGWVFLHVQRIKRELKQAGMTPRPVPKTNFLLLLTVICIAFSVLLIAYLVQ